MDGLEKTVSAAFIFVALMISAILGVGIWGFVELVLWITSK